MWAAGGLYAARGIWNANAPMELARAMGSSLSQLPDDIEAGTARGVVPSH